MRRSGSLLLVVAASALLAACGGGATPTPAGSTATTPSTPATSPSTAPASVAPPSADAATPIPSAVGAACTNASGDAVAKVTVAIKDFSYSPQPVTAAVGDVITWRNDDSAAHSATLEDDSCGTPPLAPGSSASLVFNAPGTYTYKCIIHPAQMKGFTIEVR